MNYRSLFTIIGLFLALVGSVIVTIGQFLTKEQAINIGVARYAGKTDAENEKLPQVQQLLKQSNYAKIGFVFITFGFLLQFFGVYPY
jgi:uncharacterized membrane protein